MGELNLLKKTFKKKTSKKKQSKYYSLLNKKKKYINIYKDFFKIESTSCFKTKISKTIEIYANLCNYSYKKEKPNSYKKFKLDLDYNTSYYQCYYTKNTCIIVFRGTKLDKRDLYMDYNIAINDIEKNKYFTKALNITNEIIEKYNKHKIILTGHSLGGSISLFITNKINNKIYKTYVFNPGISILPYKTAILNEYSKNIKNYFIIRLGDIISNSIIKYKPKNMICLKSDIYDNIIDLHAIKGFI